MDKTAMHGDGDAGGGNSNEMDKTAMHGDGDAGGGNDNQMEKSAKPGDDKDKAKGSLMSLQKPSEKGGTENKSATKHKRDEGKGDGDKGAQKGKSAKPGDGDAAQRGGAEKK